MMRAQHLGKLAEVAEAQVEQSLFCEGATEGELVHVDAFASVEQWQSP